MGSGWDVMGTEDPTNNDAAPEHDEEPTPCPLTSRELEVLRVLARGATNAQIARELNVTEDTVKFHIRNIFRKLGVASRTEAALVAIRQGWVKT